MLKPNPDPPWFKFLESSILKNGLKIFFLNLLGIPGPSSSISIKSELDFFLALIKIFSPYFDAFSHKLKMILNK